MGSWVAIKGNHKKILAGLDVYLKQVAQQRHHLLKGLPKSFQWEDVTISIIDEQMIRIVVKRKLIGKYDVMDLGFCRRNSSRAVPDKQWERLLWFARVPAASSVLTTVNGIQRDWGMKENDAMQQSKSRLCKILRTLFGLEKDPIPFSRESQCYKPLFRLIPDADFRDLKRSGKSFDEQYVNEFADYLIADKTASQEFAEIKKDHFTAVIFYFCRHVSRKFIGGHINPHNATTHKPLRSRRVLGGLCVSPAKINAERSCPRIQRRVSE